MWAPEGLELQTKGAKIGGCWPPTGKLGRDAAVMLSREGVRSLAYQSQTPGEETQDRRGELAFSGCWATQYWVAFETGV